MKRLSHRRFLDCSVPIISAVGHETDTTIADFVADLRAPTPSAGAELAVYDYSLMQTQLDELALRYTRRMKQQIASARMRLSNDQIRLSHLSPAGQIREKRSYLVSLEEKLERQMQELFAVKNDISWKCMQPSWMDVRR